MKTKFIKKHFPYTGEQLHSHFAYEEYGVLGNSIVAWIGPWDIPFEHMVDLEDVVAHSPIRGALMIHFIVEVFGQNLFSAVSLQRLLASIVKDEIEASSKSNAFTEDVGSIAIDVVSFIPISFSTFKSLNNVNFSV